MVMPTKVMIAYRNRRTMYAIMRRSTRRRRRDDFVRALVARNPPIHLAGIPREQAPSAAFLDVLHAFVERPLQRHLVHPRVRLILGHDLVELLEQLHALV